MAKKAGKGVMAKKDGKGGGWKPWLIPQMDKGVMTAKAWQAAMSKKKNAFAKAQASHCALAIAMAEVQKAQTAVTTAVAKAKKLEKRAELDIQKANALP